MNTMTGVNGQHHVAAHPNYAMHGQYYYQPAMINGLKLVQLD